MNLSVMMIGEFDYNDIFHGEDEMHYWLAYVLFCAFLPNILHYEKVIVSLFI